MDLGVGAPGIFSSAFPCLSRVLGCSPLSSGGKGALPGRIHAGAPGSEAQLAFGLFCSVLHCRPCLLGSDFLNKVRVWRAARAPGHSSCASAWPCGLIAHRRAVLVSPASPGHPFVQTPLLPADPISCPAEQPRARSCDPAIPPGHQALTGAPGQTRAHRHRVPARHRGALLCWRGETWAARCGG